MKVNIMRNLKDIVRWLLNKFCFGIWHDDNCRGCIFKNFEKCPLNTFVEKLVDRSKNLWRF